MLIILGSPGAGKGTQARIVSEFLDVKYISAGDSLKNKLKENVNLMEKVNTGQILDNDETNAFIVSVMNNLKKGDIFEGFPRTEKQAVYLINNFSLEKIMGVVLLNVKKEVVIHRLFKRYTCMICHKPGQKDEICCEALLEKRKDDRDETYIINRINTFQDSIHSIKEKFMQKNIKFFEINGEEDVLSVRDNIVAIYKSL